MLQLPTIARVSLSHLVDLLCVRNKNMYAHISHVCGILAGQKRVLELALCAAKNEPRVLTSIYLNININIA